MIYLGKNELLEAMVLWADSQRSRNDWIDAFEYILTDFKLADGFQTVFDMLKPQSKNSFVVAMAKSLQEYEVEEEKKVMTS